MPAIVDTAQKVGVGTVEGKDEDDAHAVLDALPEALGDGSAVVGPAEGDCETDPVTEVLAPPEAETAAEGETVAGGVGDGMDGTALTELLLVS